MKPALLLAEVVPCRTLPANAMLVLPTLTGFKPAEPNHSEIHAWSTNIPDLGVLHNYKDMTHAGLHFTLSQQGLRPARNTLLLLRLEGLGLAQLEPRLVDHIGFGQHLRVSALDSHDAVERLFVLIDRTLPGEHPAASREIRHVRQALSALVEWAEASHITVDTSPDTEDDAPCGTYVVALDHASGHCDGRITRVLKGPQRLRNQTLRFVVRGHEVNELPSTVVLHATDKRRAEPAGRYPAARFGWVTSHSPADLLCCQSTQTVSQREPSEPALPWNAPC